MIRKFYSPDGEFAGAKASDFTIIDSSAPQPEPVVETTTPEPANEETIVDTPVEVAAPAEVAPVAAPVEQPTQTAPPPAVPQEVAPQVAQKNLKALLQEDGYDEKIIGLLDRYKSGADLKPYLEAMSVDYKAMSPEEIMRREIREQYPEAEPDVLDYIFDDQVKKKYNLDEDLNSPQAIKAGQAMLKNDAEKIRQRLIEEQGKFLIPSKDFSAEQQKVQEDQARQAQEQQEQFRQSILNSPVAQSLNQSKALSVDLGDGTAFNYAVDPSGVMDLLLNPEKYMEATTKKDASGNVVPDYQTLVEVAAFLKDRKAYNKSLIAHGKSLGKKESFDALENVERPVSPAAVIGEESLADAFRNRGVRNWQR